MKILLGVLLAFVSSPALAATVFLAADGSDLHDGATMERPVATLGRVQQIIAKLPPEDFLVSIGPGTYAAQSVNWQYSMPNHTIRFVGASGQQSIFDGQRKGLTFFKLRSAKGEATNLSFEGLVIVRYVTAISLVGDREDFRRFNAKNSIIDNHFIDVGGTGFEPMGYSTAVVSLVNSDENLITGNTFKGMVGTRCKHLHGVYLAHDSSRNRIENNLFQDGCGDAVRLRDASNDNIIRSNIFRKVGDKAGVSEWFCSRGLSDCTKKTPECPPLANLVEGNRVEGDQNGAPMPEFVAHARNVPASCNGQSR